MRTILRGHRCYVRIDDATMKIDGETSPFERRLFILKDCHLGYPAGGRVRVPVSVLLDTGNDVTLVNPEKAHQLQDLIGFDIPFERRFRHDSSASLEPTYDLVLNFPGSRVPYRHPYGFMAHTSWNFEVADVWLGQDIFSQLRVTFDGPKGTVTVVDPKARPAAPRAKRDRSRGRT